MVLEGSSALPLFILRVTQQVITPLPPPSSTDHPPLFLTPPSEALEQSQGDSGDVCVYLLRELTSYYYNVLICDPLVTNKTVSGVIYGPAAE